MQNKFSEEPEVLDLFISQLEFWHRRFSEQNQGLLFISLSRCFFPKQGSEELLCKIQQQGWECKSEWSVTRDYIWHQALFTRLLVVSSSRRINPHRLLGSDDADESAGANHTVCGDGRLTAAWSNRGGGRICSGWTLSRSEMAHLLIINLGSLRRVFSRCDFSASTLMKSRSFWRFEKISWRRTDWFSFIR